MIRLREFLNMIDANFCSVELDALDRHMLVTGNKSDLLSVLSLATLGRYVVSFSPSGEPYALSVTVADVEDEGEMGEHKREWSE